MAMVSGSIHSTIRERRAPPATTISRRTGHRRGAFPAHLLEIRLDHHGHEFREADGRRPASPNDLPLVVGAQGFDFGGANKIGSMRRGPPAEADMVEGDFWTASRTECILRPDHVVLPAGLAATSNASPDVVAGEAPVAYRVEVSSASVSCRPSLICATAKEIFLVTNPRRGAATRG